ncbi:MAG: MFS transporter [Gordonia sp. (in: high G+C Gram-positive bacteria)]
MPPSGTTGTSARGWAAVAALGLAIFTVTTTEIMPIGLLQPMADDLGVSEGLIGVTVTYVAFVAALAAPTLSAATGRLDRRPLFLVVLAIFAAGNAATALAPNYAVLVVVRIIIGAGIGLVWAVVAPCAVAQVPPRSAVRATTIAYTGGSLASVLGMPVGTALGQFLGWQSTYWALAGLSAVTLAALAVLLAPTPPSGSSSLRSLWRTLRLRDLRTVLVITVLVITGAYAAYTYVTPLMVDGIGIAEHLVSVLLLVMGAAGVAGNLASGALLDRITSPRMSLALLVGLLTVALVAVLASTSLVPAAIAALLVWSVGYAALPIGLQTTAMRLAPADRGAANTLYSTGVNLSIGLGALAGAFAIDRAGPTAPTVVGMVCALLALALTFLLPTAGPRRTRAETTPGAAGDPTAR